MHDTSDVTPLIRAAEQGDQSAWTDLVDRYTPLVGSVLAGFRLPKHDAEDVVQTVWLRLVEHLGDLREPRALPMWIVTTTRNECLRLLRRGQRTRPFDPLDEAEPAVATESADLDEQLIVAERHAALLAAFAELPEHQRQLLLLLVADPPIPYAEISRRLGVPVGSIGPTRARALRRLRESGPIAGWRNSEDATAIKGGGGHDFASLGH